MDARHQLVDAQAREGHQVELGPVTARRGLEQALGAGKVARARGPQPGLVDQVAGEQARCQGRREPEQGRRGQAVEGVMAEHSDLIKHEKCHAYGHGSFSNSRCGSRLNPMTLTDFEVDSGATCIMPAPPRGERRYRRTGSQANSG